MAPRDHNVIKHLKLALEHLEEWFGFGFHQLTQLTRMQLNAVTTMSTCGLDAYLQQLSAAAKLTPGLPTEVLHSHTATSVQKLCLLSL